MNILITYVATHLLSLLESELEKDAPEIIDAAISEMSLLIKKLEAMIAAKNANASKLASPILDAINLAASAGISAAGAALENK